MDKVVLSCIDGSALSTTVCDAGAWASQRLGASLKLLHVLDRNDQLASHRDMSGNLGLGAREHLLEELVALDERRSKLALENGKHLLDAAARRAESKGITNIGKLQRHGNLVEAVTDLMEQTRLLVMGRRGEDHENMLRVIGSQLESVVRAVSCPTLITVGEFQAPRNFMIAFDGSPTAHSIVDRIAASPLLAKLPCHLVMVNVETAESRQQLADANAQLKQAGFSVEVQMLKGEPHQALLAYQGQQDLDLMVMGAYGHSRIRQFFVGSNTSKMVSLSKVPLLLLR